MIKFLPRLFSGLKFFVVVMAIAVADSLVLHFFINQIKSKYILEDALSYHQKFVPFLEEIIAGRRREVAAGKVSRPFPPPLTPYSLLPTSTPLPPTPPPTISEA